MLSGVSSQALPAGTFSSTYDNYRLIFTFTTVGSGAPYIALQMRTGVTNATGSDYFSQSIGGSSTTVVGERRASQTSLRFMRAQANGGGGCMDICRPFLATSTTLTCYGGIYDDAQVDIINGQHRVSTSYDSLIIIPDSSTITGSVAVYGYNK